MGATGGTRRSGRVHRSAVLAVLGDPQCQLQRLFVIKARVDCRSVGALQVRVRQSARTTGAFGHVVTGQLDVNAAEMRAVLRMNLERQLELAKDVTPLRLLERLVAAGAPITRFELVQPSLHQIFLQKVGASGVEAGMSGHG